ncbi:MAG: protein translocase subunit SecD [Holosporales bacterium]|jgi:protein-export membrane protein SecD|nr:protein translocase subunit SecD [Holosporales bacterium]
MNSAGKFRNYIVGGVCLLGMLLAVPNILPISFLNKLPSWFPKDTIYLGLDLSGGSHLLMEVDLDYADQERLSQVAQEVRQTLRKSGIGFSGLPYTVKLGDKALKFRLEDPTQAAQIHSVLSGVDHDFSVSINGENVEITHTDAAKQVMYREIVDKSIEIIRRRIDASGTREPVITRQGAGRILVQIPGVQDPARVKALIGRTAKLTFRLVEASAPELSSRPTTSVVGAGYQYLPHTDGSGYIAIKNQAMVGGDMLTDARQEYDEFNRSQVSFKFNNIGAKRFAKVTRENVGKRFAIVLDGKVISAPVIQEAITGGAGRITSSHFSVQEASDLALLLRAGALPAPLKAVEERIVGPGLGSDSIKAGTVATIIAIVFVALFMMLVYGWFGVIASIAVVFNIVLLIAALSCLQATLTLPGIAGIALTVGMAVDANVLINERIREELRGGAKPRQAVEAGYQRAFSSILDSNLTTLFGTACLYVFGSGSIRGFAVTLSLGILASMFTAITLTRLIVDHWYLKGNRPRNIAF